MARHQTKIVNLGWTEYLNPPREDLSYLTILGRSPVKVQNLLRDATLAVDAILRRLAYPMPCGPIGSLSVRFIAGTETWSMHAYGLAIDIDYGNNPYLRGVKIPRGFGTDKRFRLTEEQVDAIEGLRTNNGKQIWRWLGWSIGDTMHFEVACRPEDLATGLAGGIPEIPEGDDEDMTIIRDGDKSELVRLYQEGLQGFDETLLPKYGPDGDYGTESIEGTNALQRFLGEQVTPEVSLAVYATALTFRPTHAIVPPDVGGALANARVDELVAQIGAINV